MSSDLTPEDAREDIVFNIGATTFKMSWVNAAKFHEHLAQELAKKMRKRD